MQDHYSHPFWNRTVFIKIQRNDICNKTASDLKHRYQEHVYKNGRCIWGDWDLIRDVQDDDSHGEEGLDHQGNSLAKFWRKHEGHDT